MAARDPDDVIWEVRHAFGITPPPRPDRIAGSREGCEPGWVADEFAGERDWEAIDARKLDSAPRGLGSALSFFSHEAFRFFLPAYLVADLEGKLDRVDPVFHVSHGLTASSCDQRINPRRYGARTWRDYAGERFAAFTAREARGVVAYLAWVAAHDEIERDDIEDALPFWRERADDRPVV